jgi:hypothetical protein
VFLHHLNDPQKIAFLKVALFMIRLDGVVDLREEVVLDWALRDMGLNHSELPPCPAQLEDVLGGLEAFRSDGVAATVLLIESLRIMASDHLHDPAQQEALRAIAERVGLPAGHLERCQSYAERLQAVIEEGQALVADS